MSDLYNRAIAYCQENRKHPQGAVVPAELHRLVAGFAEQESEGRDLSLASPALTEALETADNIKGLSINESIAVKAIVIALREARGE